MMNYTLLREMLIYNPETGIFVWKIGRKGRGTKAGAIAGSIKKGRVYIGISNKAYFAHRLAWLYMIGEWPKYQIDHINGDTTDNRWVNLRDVDQFTNQQNQRKAHNDNQWGLLGVRKCIACKTKPYYAGITVDGFYVHLGYFPTSEEAHDAYLNAKRKLHRGCTI
jgi:hypothetical protein